MTQESVILCEGYHDRAFWDGWLRYLKCQVPLANNKALSARIVKDPWGRTVSGGQFGYHSPTGNFVRIVPCGGDDFVSDALKNRLAGRTTHALRHIAVTYDADTDARTEADAKMGIEAAHNSVQTILRAVEPSASPAGPKEYAWSNMAGWAADKNCEAFYSGLWSNPQIVTELQSRLEKTGAWRITEQVAA